VQLICKLIAHFRNSIPAIFYDFLLSRHNDIGTI